MRKGNAAGGDCTRKTFYRYDRFTREVKQTRTRGVVDSKEIGQSFRRVAFIVDSEYVCASEHRRANGARDALKIESIYKNSHGREFGIYFTYGIVICNHGAQALQKTQFTTYVHAP